MTLSEGVIDETIQVEMEPSTIGARSWMLLASPENIWKFSLSIGKVGAMRHASSLGGLIWYWHQHWHTGRRKRIPMNIEALVAHWTDTIALMATAHTKDEADRQEAAIDSCLTPILSAPIKQVREFADKLKLAMEADPRIPYLVWRTYAAWADKIIVKASDEDVIVLKTDLAAEIVKLVESDVQAQLPDALMRALQWRSPEQLEKALEVITKEKGAGKPVRLRGRQSCLFLEAGGTEEAPEVCVEV